MAAAWDQCQIYYPDLRSRECVPNAPGTIPFSVNEVYLMDKLILIGGNIEMMPNNLL